MLCPLPVHDLFVSEVFAEKPMAAYGSQAKTKKQALSVLRVSILDHAASEFSPEQTWLTLLAGEEVR